MPHGDRSGDIASVSLDVTAEIKNENVAILHYSIVGCMVGLGPVRSSADDAKVDATASALHPVEEHALDLSLGHSRFDLWLHLVIGFIRHASGSSHQVQFFG